MERGPFLDDEIQREFGRFVMIELHTDGTAPKTREHSRRNRELQRELYGSVALPYYALLDPSGEHVYWKRGGAMSRDEFLAALRAVP